VLNWSDEINRFNFDYKGKAMTVVVSAAQVAEDQDIVMNNEHTEYKWVSFDEAIEMMKFEDDKNGLRVCREKLLGKIS
jgi:8-oxo-dGTP pyrophosphatase MutT (NUDIX family)